ncbi:nucleolar protein 16 [Aspergillus candidus]|uniref:Nucleolar protein 16 n=1 Tax=Aspergillus candidus TaxID=41067 RepID=A0A2I2FPS2_ASPCN|nr:60S ribosomal subunit biogenesis protein Nop16 [Aspergillus candidus]PLB42628.1 60S ribosomal subunit biogenesis protein Nop16 [Aspergillus candidus]
MTNIRQAKKLRSSRPKATAKRNGRLKSGKKKVNVLGNAIIAENWDRNLTLTQNYRRLGLMHRLNAPAGGSQRITTDTGFADAPENNLHIKGSAESNAKNLKVGETRVERDPETGRILRVINDDEVEIAGRKHKRANPLNDPLNDLAVDVDIAAVGQAAQGKDASAVVRQLEMQAAKEDSAVLGKKPRHTSTREGEWIEKLVQKHGDDYAAMARDKKLNPMQQTVGDIKRRIRKFEAGQA